MQTHRRPFCRLRPDADLCMRLDLPLHKKHCGKLGLGHRARGPPGRGRAVALGLRAAGTLGRGGPWGLLLAKPHKLVLFATVIALWTLVTLLIKLIRILLKWKYIQDQNYAIFGRYVVRAKLFCLKRFVPVSGMKCSYEKIFIPVTEISVAKTEISVTGPARPLI